MFGKIRQNIPLLQLLCTDDPMIFPKHVLALRKGKSASTGFDLRVLVHLLSTIPDAYLLVR